MDAESTDLQKHENEKLREELSEHHRQLQAQARENAGREVRAMEHTEETLAQVSGWNVSRIPGVSDSTLYAHMHPAIDLAKV